MKTVILCGGRGTRLNEMGAAVPKALLDIGGKPVIWHLLRSFASYGFSDFVLCLGHLGDKISDHFAEIAVSHGPDNELRVCSDGLDCRVLLVETGADTNTGGRIKAIEPHISEDQTFFVTYGDGLSNVDLSSLLRFHNEHGKLATLTAVHPVSPFGILALGANDTVEEFREKPRLESWINGGFFVFEHGIFEYLTNDPVLEQGPLARLAAEHQLMAFRHEGFWKCMDTHKDNAELNALWKSGAPWKNW